jgi:N-acetylneuraminic acid mutarotase
MVFIVDLSNPTKFDKLISMNKPRYGHASVFMKNCVYVFGGYSHQDTPEGCKDPISLNSVEKYTFKEGLKEEAWKICSPMVTERSFFGTCAVEEQIYAFGGLLGYHPINMIEVYNT